MFNESLPVVRDPRSLQQASGAQERPKKKKDFWTDQISTAGGILGGIAGIPLGVFGAAGGSALGSGLGEALENLLIGEDVGNNVAKEAILGGVLGAGPLRLGGALLGKVAPRAGKSLEQTGNNLLGTQANLTRAETRQLGTTPAETLGAINQRTGLTNINKATDVGGNVTGKNGVLSELTKNAIGNTPGVDISDLRTVADNLLTDKAPLLTDTARKNVINQVKNSTVKSYGGSKGSLNQLANPFDAFETARGFEASAARIRGAANASPADQQLADVYSSLAGEIKNRLFSAPGVNQGVEMARGSAAETFRQLAKNAPSRSEKQAYEKLAKEAESFTDVSQVRSAQAPFVQLGKIDQATARAQSGAASQLGDNMQGLGKVLQRPTNIVAMPLNAATPAVGGALARTGRNLQGAGSPVRPGGVAARVGAGGLVSSMLGGGESAAQPVSLEDALMGQSQAGMLSPDMMMQEQPQVDPYPRENLLYDIQRDPQNAEKYLSYYAAIQEAFAGPPEKPLSTTAAKDISNAQTGLDAVGLLEQQLMSDPGLQTRGGISGAFNPFGLVSGALGTGEYENARAQARDVIGRIRTGAALTADEAKAFDRFLPQPGDSQGTVQQKLAFLRNQFSTVANRNNTGADLSSALMAAQGI